MATVFRKGSRDELPLKLDTVTGLDRLMVTLVDEAGAPISISVSGSFTVASEYAEDTPFVDGDIGSLSLGVRADAVTGFTSTDGDRSAFAVSRFGETMISVYSALPVSVSGTVPVSIAATVAVSVASLPLPAGAATEATLAALNAKVTTVNTGAVVLATGTATIGKVDQGVGGASAWLVSASSLPLPTGAATLVEQQTQSTTLSAISGKLPATLGQKAMAASFAVVLASDQSAIPVTISGGSAGVQYTEGDTDASITGTALMWEDASDTLRAVSAAKPLPISGTIAVSGTVPVSIAGTVAISAVALPLPAGAATEATLSAMSAKLPAAIGQTTMAASLAVVLASNQSSIPVAATLTTSALTIGKVDQGTGGASAWKVDGSAVTQPVSGTVAISGTVPVSGTVAVSSVGGTVAISAASLPLPTGAATETTLAAASAKLPATLGQKPMATSLAVVLASDQSAIPVTGGGGGTQYTEGDTDASITGTALLWEDTSDTLRAVSAAKPLPVAQQGTVTVTGTVTANAGTGTFAVSAVSLPLPSGAATETTLAAASAKLPATLGQKAMTASLAVVLASDQSSVPVSATLVAGTGTQEVVGDVASDAPVVANPVTIGGRASAASPSNVSTDGDAVDIWLLRNGAQATSLTSGGVLIGGDNVFGLDVDVTRLPAPLNVSGGGTEATALRVTLANNSTGILSQLPATIGTKTSALSLGVVLASDQAAVPVSGTLAVQGNTADGAAFTAGISRILTPGYLVDETAGSTVAEDALGAARMQPKRAQIHVLEDGVTAGRYATVTAANAVKVDGSGATQPVSGTVAVSSITTAIVPGTGATNLGKAEDAAHTTGDVGVMALSVRNENLSATFLAGTAGDYQALQSDVNGALFVNVLNTLDLASQTLEDTLSVDLDVGVRTLAVRFDEAATDGATQRVGTNLDYCFPSVDRWGKVFQASDKKEDRAHVDGDIGSFVLGVINPLSASMTTFAASGDYCPIATDVLGRATTLSCPSSVLYTLNFAVDGTAVGPTQDIRNFPCKHWSLQVKGVGAAANTWNVGLYGSLDGTNFQAIATPIALHNTGHGDGNVMGSGLSAIAFPFPYFRIRSQGLVLAPATSINVTVFGMP